MGKERDEIHLEGLNDSFLFCNICPQCWNHRLNSPRQRRNIPVLRKSYPITDEPIEDSGFLKLSLIQCVSARGVVETYKVGVNR